MKHYINYITGIINFIDINLFRLIMEFAQKLMTEKALNLTVKLQCLECLL